MIPIAMRWRALAGRARGASAALVITGLTAFSLSLASCRSGGELKAAPAVPRSTPAPTPSPSASPIALPAPVAATVPARLTLPTLVPLPAAVSWSEAPGFTVTPATAIVVPPNDPRAALVGSFLSRWLTTVGATGVAVIPAMQSDRTGVIVLTLDGSIAGDEAYTLSVNASQVRITARSAAGLFYGAQTLRQLLPAFLEYEAARPRAIVVPAVEIADQPRFAWRGAMLDVARHFFGVQDVKRYIDLIALHKMNRLHLHLSDDQGWRIEIKSWPSLTAVGGRSEVGGGPGGFFTQVEYADIVAYARDRFVDIIPEIDMPGHTNAALASYAELNCDGVPTLPYTDIRVGFSSLCVGNETTYRFIDDVVREISALSPSPYFHAGGDEVRKLTPVEYASFINRVQQIVQMRGKQMIGWDEIAAATLSTSSVIQHWRPGTKLGDAVANGVKLIMSPANRAYLDMQYDPATPLGLFWAGRIEVRDAYAWDPATLMEGVSESSILGVEAPLWSETLGTMRDVEMLAFPRIAVIAEVGWSQQSHRDWEDFRVRLGGQGPRWQALGINFYRSPQIPWRP